MLLSIRLVLGRRRRFAGAEQGSRVSQGSLNPFCERVRATEYAPRGRFTLHERTHGLAEISDKRHTAFKSTKPLSNCTTWGLWQGARGGRALAEVHSAPTEPRRRSASTQRVRMARRKNKFFPALLLLTTECALIELREHRGARRDRPAEARKKGRSVDVTLFSSWSSQSFS